MPVTIDEAGPVQFITSNHGQPDYPRQVVVDLGRPGMSYGIEMRDLIHWTAYRLDTGTEGSIVNHRAAVALRSIAERYFPYIDDEADYIAEELEIELNDFGLDRRIPQFDSRLLDLVDGMVFVRTSFEETLWTGQQPHSTLASNAANTIDFEFPAGVFEEHGICGIRLAVNDLINWLLEGENSMAMAFMNEHQALDELEASRRRSAADRCRRERQLVVSDLLGGPTVVHYALAAEEQDEILQELSALI